MTKAKAAGKVPVTSRALVQRINRALAKRDGCVHGAEWPHRIPGQQSSCLSARVLKTSRGAAEFSNFGDHYVLDVARSIVVDHHVGLEDLARELGVLEAWETLAA